MGNGLQHLGIQLANKCLLSAAVWYNLKRLLKWTGENLKNTEETRAKCFLCYSPSWCSRVENAVWRSLQVHEAASVNYRIENSENEFFKGVVQQFINNKLSEGLT